MVNPPTNGSIYVGWPSEQLHRPIHLRQRVMASFTLQGRFILRAIKRNHDSEEVPMHLRRGVSSIRFEDTAKRPRYVRYTAVYDFREEALRILREGGERDTIEIEDDDDED